MTDQPMSDEQLAQYAAEPHPDSFRMYCGCYKPLVAEVRRRGDSIVKLNQDLDAMRGERDEALARVAELEQRAREAEGDLCDIDSEIPRLYEIDEDGEPNEDRPASLYERVQHVVALAEKAEAEVERLRALCGQVSAWDRSHEREGGLIPGPLNVALRLMLLEASDGALADVEDSDD